MHYAKVEVLWNINEITYYGNVLFSCSIVSMTEFYLLSKNLPSVGTSTHIVWQKTVGSFISLFASISCLLTVFWSIKSFFDFWHTLISWDLDFYLNWFIVWTLNYVHVRCHHWSSVIALLIHSVMLCCFVSFSSIIL